MSLDSATVSPESLRPERACWPIQRAGISGLLLALSAALLEVLAIGIGSARTSAGGSGTAWITATVIAWVVISMQAVSFTLGLVAIFRGRGQARHFGAAAVLVSLLTNPLLLIALFSLLRDTP
jgi:hypothetical protein